jgi:ribonuclease T1
VVWRLVRGVLNAGIALALVACGPAGDAREQPARGQEGDIALADLPREARDTLVLIKRGGPFTYRKDGSTFGNREGHLPRRPRGYYTEYTVHTPWERDRGARRIVAGKGDTGDPATGGEYYYTDDHYNSFRRIRE